MKNDIKSFDCDKEMLSAFRLADLGGFFKDALRVVVRNKTGVLAEKVAYEECGSNISEYFEFAQRLDEQKDLYHRLYRHRCLKSIEYAPGWFADVSAKYVLDDLRGTNAYPRQKGFHKLLLCQRIQWILDHDMDPHDASYEDEFKTLECDYLDDIIMNFMKEDDSYE